MASWTAICNNQKFDLLNYFRENKFIIWRQPKNCAVGDYVFFYLSAPYSEMRFATRVVENEIHDAKRILPYYLESSTENIVNGKTRWPYMRIEFIREMDTDDVKRPKLLDYGMRSFQKGTFINSDLEKYLYRVFQIEGYENGKIN